MFRSLRVVMAVLLVCAFLASPAAADTEREGYTLDRVTVLSRHNIRSPLSGSGSLLGDITPHEWFKWTSNPSELSLRGGVSETMMGQYFRKWLESEALFPENYQPTEEEVRIYANSMQRTIATARYFSAGLLPASNLPVERHMELNTMDPTIWPKLHFLSNEYAQDAIQQIAEKGGVAGLEGIHAQLLDAIELLMDVTDMEDSEAYQSGKFGDLRNDKTEMILELGEEPKLTGPIKTATSVADALTFQYYEEPDDIRAAFGHELTTEDWIKIHSIVDTYTWMLFSAPLISIHEAHPLLEEIRSELTKEGRKFSFLCGHDSNIASVLSALGVEEYELPETVEPKTPIGVKLVFERWLDENKEAYYAVNLVYQSTEQLRKCEQLTLDNPPMKAALQFKGVKTNADGLIAEKDLFAMLDGAINAYDELMEKYGAQEQDAAA